MAKHQRDYSLVGPDGRDAVEIGLASAEWYHSEVPRKVMKDLMKRSDGPAIRDTLIWLGSMGGFAVATIALWPSFWSLPFLMAYAVLYASGEARWHECGHGTAFRTQWMNDAVYQIGSFMVMRNPVVWRWSHSRHHTDTIIVGRDNEIAIMRPPRILSLATGFFSVKNFLHRFWEMLRYAAGHVSEEERTYIPERELPKVAFYARVWTAIFVAVIASCFYFSSVLPILMIGGPRLYGGWHGYMCGVLQHGGLAEDVLDHRLNSRTVLMNPVSRFLYWNMNYHIEHHMFPMVPYHALPRLHEVIKHDLPPPNTSILDAHREMWPALKRQVRDPEYTLVRKLPPTARPYRAEFHEDVFVRRTPRRSSGDTIVQVSNA